ncbi:MAG: hypothetical protein Ta2B_17910 [Termitinemataceae bacterium]|nr:MAG: hypothetical protein Ta2B_17910 [Termitinemataceae bacterium]
MQYLWSGHDVYLEHSRRYNRIQLVNIIQKNNFKIIKCHYFYTSLYIALFGVLKILKKEYPETEEDAGFGNWKYSGKNIFTKIVKKILNIDFCVNKHLNKIGLHLPGLSILAVCRKI